MDLKPSLLSFVGAKAADKAISDGEDVLETVLGKSDLSRQSPIYYSRPPDRKITMVLKTYLT